ncbi:hypothetical protein MN116_004367 [Schistosoma mekongi]|uniref:Lamin-B receptor n=1 Tax=Schistosoma mekongi TaxID=38744 RepID=A0AAE1ZGE0_SCHME|nr:hypothetical protein MN116_004367 [Schistosoma mekongi]
MPPKKKTNDIATRGRSKSASRNASKNVRSPNSRSRSKTPTRRARTPASESKVRRRRSPSNEPSEDSMKKVTKSGQRIETIFDHPVKTDVLKPLPLNYGLSRLSQKIVKKIESEQPHFYQEEIVQKSEIIQSHKPVTLTPFLTNYRKTLFSPSVVATIQILFIIPFVYWLNLLVFAPASVTNFSGENKSLWGSAYPLLEILWPTGENRSLWGPAFPLLGVLWPTDWHVYINIRSFALISMYLLLQCLVARFLPFGRLMTTGLRNIDYHCNSLICFAILIGLFAFAQVSEYTTTRNVRPSEMLPKLWLGLLTSSCLASVFVSLVAYFASKTVVRYTRQSSAKSSSTFLDFWYGRYIRPQWLGIDWKMVLTRSGMMALPLIDATYIFSQYERYERISPALAAHALMHALWVLDFFVFEHAFSFTYEMQSVTFGSSYIIGRLVVLPFTYSITSSYLSSRPDVGRQLTSSSLHSCNAWIMGVAIAVFLLGLWIHRRANNQKYIFRRDPHHPSFANAEIIAGPGTQRLLVSGWWGCVRHPNYVGYIIMAVAMSIPCGFDSPTPWVIPVIVILYLIHRTLVVEEACLRKHGPAWQKYTALVPYRFIHKIF